MTMRYEKPRFALDEHNSLYDLSTGQVHQNLNADSPHLLEDGVAIDLNGVKESIIKGEHTHHHYHRDHVTASPVEETQSPVNQPPASDPATFDTPPANASQSEAPPSDALPTEDAPSA